MAHNLLDGQVVKGNHERLISEELFLEVNGLLTNNPHFKLRYERRLQHKTNKPLSADTTIVFLLRIYNFTILEIINTFVL